MIDHGTTFFTTGYSFELYSLDDNMIGILAHGPRGGYLSLTRLRLEDLDKLIGALLKLGDVIRKQDD